MFKNPLLATQNELDELTRMRYRGQVNDEFFNNEKVTLQNKVMRLKAQLRDTEQRAESWLELSERTFNFALYARKAFVMGTLEAKREILTALGENPLLNDGKLSIYGYEWLQPIKNGYPELEAEFEALELTKTPINSVRNEALTSIRTRWRGIVEDVRTIFMRQNQYIYIPDLSDFENRQLTNSTSVAAK
jgi:hypothetical protein